MIARCFAGLAALALLLSATDLRAAGRNRCGFDLDGLRVQRMNAGVPLLLAPIGVPRGSESRVMSRRNRLIGSERACSGRHPTTSRYLRSILDRLVQGSGLQAFASCAPNLALVLTCESSPPLPGARATAGNLILVPRALPAFARSEDAIAAVLGHELAHLTLRHPEQLIEATSGITALPRGAARTLKSAHEREADITGLQLAVNAGYDPHAALDHLQWASELAGRLKRSGQLRARRTAPVHDGRPTRMQRLSSQIEACAYPRASARTPVARTVKAELASWARAQIPRQRPRAMRRQARARPRVRTARR